MNLQMESTAHNSIHNFPRAERQMLTDENPNVHISSPMLALDAHGLIQECDASVESIFGYGRHELVWQHVSCLFPKLAEVTLMQGNRLDPMLNYICHCDHIFDAVNKKGELVICHLNFYVVENKGMSNLKLIVRPVGHANQKQRRLHADRRR